MAPPVGPREAGSRVESVEASGKSIEDAILQALARLGRNRDEVEITVLQEPSRGSRGMGARDARVRVYLRAQPGAGYDPAAQDYGPQYADDYGAYPGAPGAPGLGEEYTYEQGYDQAAPGYPQEYAEGEEDALASVAGQTQGLITAALDDALPPDASAEDVAIEALRMILGHMGIRCEIEALEPTGDELLILNIVPVDNQPLSLLIGRRGETLAALQLIVNMIVTKQAGHHERVIVDAEGYRQRREDNLRVMAERIAAQVRSTGTSVTLEAMSPNERRLIHMALADYSDISSESTGEGDQRRVVVALKRSR